MAAIDVTDATFETDVIAKSKDVPVVVDLWAPWCNPCKTLGPIIEEAVDSTGGEVVLAKVNVDENPAISQAFKVQSIPAVYALKDGAVVEGFVGAHPASTVQKFVDSLLPSDDAREVSALLETGDEESLRRALELEPANEDVIVALGELLVEAGQTEEALKLVARIPESERTKRIAAAARVGGTPDDDVGQQLDALLDDVKHDPDARQQYLDLLELMGADDPRTAEYRRKLTTRLY